jgi:YD repeat-containing protein
MRTSHRINVRLILFLFLAFGSGAASGSELLTRYIWGGVTYTSLQGAEQALWQEDFIGAAYYTYQYTWYNGLLRRYDHPPTTKTFEDPRLAFWSSPGIACDNSPLYDQFGNDFCSNASPGQCCASEENWWAGVQKAFSSVDCPPVKTGEGPWEQSSFVQVGYPMKLPEEYLILRGRYSKFIDAEFPPGNSPLCGTNHDFILRAVSPGHCPGGYAYFGYIGGIDRQCYVGVSANMNVSGAKVAEPGPGSCSVGNPCHPATGDKTLSESDFSASTLPFSRHYHSHQVYPDFAAMGKGWSHTYSGRILVEGGTIKVIDGEGNAERFECADSPACSSYSSTSESGQVLRPVAGGWDVYLSSGEIRQYDSSGKLILITDRSGKFREVAITYNASGHVSEVIDQSGRALQLNYNASGLVGSVTLPDGQKIHYHYESPPADTTNNPRYNLVRVIREDLTERQYHYEDRDDSGADRYGHLLTGITDENGVRFAAYTYDDHARVTSSERAGGAGRIDLKYTRRAGESYNWSVTEVTMPLGEVVTYDMEPGPFRKLTDIEDTRGRVAMSYDPATNWLSSKTDREGNRTAYIYDKLHETSRIEAVGTVEERTIETDWDNTTNRVMERRESGQSTRYSYNSRGQVLTLTIEDAATLATRTWTYRYYELPSPGPLIGQLRTIDGPRTDVSDVTTIEYYTSDHPDGDFVMGDMKAMVNALGHSTDYLRYDRNGRPLEILDANKVLTELTYHPRGWISTRSTDGKTTFFSYDDVGNLTRIAHPDGSHIDYQYDNAHRLTAMADNFNNRVEYTLDAAGNRTAEKTYDDMGVLRRQLSRVYDALNRLDRLIDGNGSQTQYSYDNNGNPTGSLDANLNATSFEYDPLDRLAKTIDSILGESLMTYDDRDNLTRVTDPLSNVTRYNYDGLDNQTGLESPDTGITTYEYDEAGNRTAATDARNIRTEYTHDSLNRPSHIFYPDNSLDVDFTYDAGTNGKGRLTGMTDAAGTVDYTYDRRGNLLEEGQRF